MKKMTNINIALIHHWLVSLRGGEKVLEQFSKIFPKAEIHTLVKTKSYESLGKIIPEHQIHTTIINWFPRAEKLYKSFLPLFPTAIGSHKVGGDFILSSDASLIKGMKKEEHVPHVCYCHSPPRYLWDLQEDYLASMGRLKAAVFKKITPYLQDFDQKGAQNVDYFIANSNFVKERIQRIYGRESIVIHPPVELDEFHFTKTSEDFYLVVAAFVPYKKLDIAVKAYNKNGKKLVVIGEGSEIEYLKSIAKENVKILGSQSFDVLKEHYQKCKAFVFPGIEDFGITPLEAQASGKPVIAIKKGGALETVIENKTGIFFDEQTPESLNMAISKFESGDHSITPEACRKNAEEFSPERFRKEIKEFLISKYPNLFRDYTWGDIPKNLKEN